MKYEIFYEQEGHIGSETFHGENPGEAFAKCLLKRPTAKLIKCKKGGQEIGEAFTEWPAPPVQRMPEDPPYIPPAPKIPKYKQDKEPMPAMKDWYEKHKPTESND